MIDTSIDILQQEIKNINMQIEALQNKQLSMVDAICALQMNCYRENREMYYD